MGPTGMPGGLGTDNPIEGSPLDPKRRMFLTGQQPGQIGQRMMDAGAPMNAPLPDAVNIGANAAPSMPDEHPDESHSDYSPAGAGATGTPGTAGTGQRPSLLRAGEQAPIAGMADPSSSMPVPDRSEEIFNRIMQQSMDDTPSQARIAALDDRIAQMRKKPSLGQRLLQVGLMAAPTVAAAAFGGGDAGVAGAAEGTVAANREMYGRRHEQYKELVAQDEAERQRQERQYERRMQLPLTYMGMQMRRDYQNAMINWRNKNTDTIHGDKMMALGLDQNGQPIPEDQLPAKMKGQVLAMRAHKDLYDAQSAYAEAREELARAQNDPNSPVYQLAKRKVDATLAMVASAQQRAEAMMKSAEVREATYYKSAYGTDVEGNTLPGTYVDPNTNQPMGWNAPGNPTANTKQRGQTAATVLHHFDDSPNDPNPAMRKGLITSINELTDDDVGGLKGHVNEWLLGKYGMNNPRLSQLRTKLMLTASAMELSHVGQSGGIEMLDHFKSMLNLGQGKQNLAANAAEIKGWLSGYAAAGTPNAPAGIGATNKNFRPLGGGGGSRTKLTKPGAGGGGTVKWEKGPDGRPRPVAAGAN